MLATDPRDLQDQFVTYFTSGNLDALMELYEADALFVGPGGEASAGAAAIREALSSLMSLPELAFTYSPYFAAQSADVVLMHASWKLTGRVPETGPVSMAGVTVEVARRGADGGWRYAVDCPFGTASITQNESS